MLKITYKNGNVEELDLKWNEWSTCDGFLWLLPNDESYRKLINIEKIEEVLELNKKLATD